MILCVTPNPAIDRTLFVEEFHPGEVHRAQKTLTATGGKGVNVARSIRTLGGDPLCMGLIGGHGGNLLAQLAEQEGLASRWTRMQSETRTCFILVHADQDATVINDVGGAVDVNECQSFVEDVWREAVRASMVCVCGSLPPGFPLELFASMLAGFVEQGKPVWVDASGPVLKTALGVRGINIKVNARELGEVLNINLPGWKQAPKAIHQLKDMGIEQVSITFGKEGAILSNSIGIWKAQTPKLEIISSVGSGDSFLGGLIVALEAGDSAENALRQATAAGAANALSFGGGIFSLLEFEMIREKTSSLFTPYDD